MGVSKIDLQEVFNQIETIKPIIILLNERRESKKLDEPTAYLIAQLYDEFFALRCQLRDFLETEPYSSLIRR